MVQAQANVTFSLTAKVEQSDRAAQYQHAAGSSPPRQRAPGMVVHELGLMARHSQKLQVTDVFVTHWPPAGAPHEVVPT